MVDILIAGVGMTATALQMGSVLGRGYDLAVNIGIAGAFIRSIPLGTVVFIESGLFRQQGHGC